MKNIEPSKELVLITLGNCVLDSEKLKECLIDNLRKTELYKDIVDEAINHSRNDISFNTDSFINYLCDKQKADLSTFARILYQSCDVGQFLFKDAFEFIKTYSKYKNIVLLVNGIIESAEQRVESSGLTEYINGTAYMLSDSAEILNNTLHFEGLVSKFTPLNEYNFDNIHIIDGNPERLSRIRPNIKTTLNLIRVRRKNFLYSEKPTPEGIDEVSNFSEIFI